MSEAVGIREDDLKIAAKTVFGEARGEDFDGQVAVMSVIRNRARKPQRFGVGIRGVCLKEKQFSCWGANDPNRYAIEAAATTDPAFLRALGVAALVLTGDLPDPTGGADHYHTTAISPYWAKDMLFLTEIGNHRFLKEVRRANGV